MFPEGDDRTRSRARETPAQVNDANEVEIARAGGLSPVLDGARSPSPDLQAQSARALRNLSVNPANQRALRDLDGIPALRELARSTAPRTAQQAARALANLGVARDDAGGPGSHK